MPIFRKNSEKRQEWNNIRFVHGKPYIDTGVEGRSREETIKRLRAFLGTYAQDKEKSTKQKKAKAHVKS